MGKLETFVSKVSKIIAHTKLMNLDFERIVRKEQLYVYNTLGSSLLCFFVMQNKYVNFDVAFLADI